MERLSQQEFETAKEIVALGLTKAAQSLSFFMKEDISLKGTAFNMDRQSHTFDSPSYYVLSTEIKGELGGVCFLIFTPEEKDEICRVALPEAILNNPEKLQGMQEPLLLEVDNIISASVITQLANKLHVKIHGDVPTMAVRKNHELAGLINDRVKPDKLILEFQTEFVSSKSHFNPEFVWVLEPQFINRVREILTAKANG